MVRIFADKHKDRRFNRTVHMPADPDLFFCVHTVTSSSGSFHFGNQDLSGHIHTFRNPGAAGKVRPSAAASDPADQFRHVHRNIFGSDDVYGDEIWKSSNASEEASALADNVMSALEGVGMQRNRGVREGSQDGNGDYAVLRNTEMCSILMEMGFMQNKKDNKYFDKNVDAYAEAVTQAVLDTWEEFHVDLDDVANLD